MIPEKTVAQRSLAIESTQSLETGIQYSAAPEGPLIVCTTAVENYHPPM